MNISVAKIGGKFFAVLNILTVMAGEQCIGPQVWIRKKEFKIISFEFSVYLPTGRIAACI